MGMACSMNEEEENMQKLLVGKSKGKKPLEDQDIGVWIILRCILERLEGLVWTGSI
jgi:hypothetical protein